MVLNCNTPHNGENAMEHPFDVASKMLQYDNPDDFKAWLDADNDPFFIDEFGNSLLHRAAALRAPRILDELLTLGLAPNIPNSRDRTPPIGHCFTAEPVILLRRYGASLTQENNEGYSPLHHAAASGRVEVVSTLIALGADMYAPCSESEYPAAFQAFILSECTVSVLVAFAAVGFDMKGKDGDWTLLHKAVNEKHHEARDFLLDLGADPTFKDDEGCDVAAIEERNRKLARLMGRKRAVA